MSDVQNISSTAEAPACPICQRVIKRRRKPRLLYETEVCRKCYYRLAARRRLAFVIDSIVAWIPWMVLLGVAVVFGFPSWGAAPSPTPPATALPLSPWMVASYLLSGIVVALFPFKDGFRGHSPGKWVCGIQVVIAETMAPIGFGVSFKRNIPILVPNAIVFVAGMIGFGLDLVASVGQSTFFLIIAFRLQRGQRWGERSAGTKVVLKKYSHRIPFDVRGVLCIECGYNLYGNVSGICPECGTPVAVAPPLDDNALQAQPAT